MARTAPSLTGDLTQQLVETYAVNERINQILLEQLDPRAWRAQLPGNKGRTIAAIFAHVHNVRCKWIRPSAPHLKVPPLLDRSSITQKQVQRAFAKSGALCSQMLADALSGGAREEVSSRRMGSTRDPGAAMVTYMIVHEAHHRVRVSMLAHQLGFPLRGKAAWGIWGWERLWKECGFGRLP